MSLRTFVRVAAIAGLAGLVILLALQPFRHSDPSMPVVLEQPSSQPATRPATQPQVIANYMALVHRDNPSIAATQPLGIPVNLGDASHLVLGNRAYVDSALNLWITDPAAPPTGAVLRAAAEEQVHIVEHPVHFVYWALNDEGQWQPALVVPDRSNASASTSQPATKWLLVDLNGKRPIGSGRDYDWRRAMSWNGQLVVPTSTGIAMFQIADEIRESHFDLIAPDDSAASPQMLLDWRGLLAWVPPAQNHPGSDGAGRFVDGRWRRLDSAAGWPQRIVQLLPLLDGSVLQMTDAGENRISISLAALDTPQVNRQQIVTLVEQLSDPVGDNRISAFNSLMQHGPGTWPVLEELAEDQPPEARARIAQLLQNRLRPTLFGMNLVEGPVRVLKRFDDGGALLYASSGVYFDPPDKPREYVAPAWIAIRPGPRAELLPEQLVGDLNPDRSELFPIQSEWVVLDEALGPQRFLGNHLKPMLRSSQRQFTYPYAIDRRGRWLFREDRDGASGRTLIIDPTIPDPAPKLPVWTMRIQGGQVGWTADGWPVTQRGGAWVLEEEAWRPLDETKERMITEVEPEVEVAPASRPATAPAAEPPILVDADGNRYYDGKTRLRIERPDGSAADWTLPPAAVGSDQPRLFRNREGLLFLLNAPGRVARIKPTPDRPEPFVLERIFTRNIPHVEEPTRIWMDRADRIAIAHDNNLTLLFTRPVPRSIQLLMPAEEEEADESE